MTARPDATLVEATGGPWLATAPSGWSNAPLFAWFGERRRPNTDGEVQNVLSLSYGHIIPRDVESNFGLLPASFNTYQVVEAGDTVLRLTDLQNDKRSLRTGLARERGIISSAYITLKPTPTIEPRFGQYLLHALDIGKVFYTMGGGLRQTMSFGDLKRLRLAAPATPYQGLIADFLDRETEKIDTLVAKKRRLIELLEEKRTALISHAVSKGLDSDVPMKVSGVEWLTEIPVGWQGRSLKRCVSTPISDGPHETPEFADEGVPFLSAEAVQGGVLDFARKRGFISLDLHEEYIRKCRPRRGDILLCKSGATTGKLALVQTDVEFSVWSPLALIRGDESVIRAEFLALALEAAYVQNQIRRTWSEGTQPNISMNALGQLFVAVPPLGVQDCVLAAVRGRLASCDHIVSLATSCLDKLSEYRSALITAAVTGQIEVREYGRQAS